jgi:hypothetical protein
MIWERTNKFDAECAALADRHYSRRKVGSPQFMPPGQTIVLRAPGAVWGWWRPAPSSGIKAMNGLDGWTCTIFRNEVPARASSLMVLDAELFLPDCGPDGALSYVWDKKIRSTNPGACYKIAGWCRKGRSADGKKTLLQRSDFAVEAKDISSEKWREYDFAGRVYRIANPRTLYIGKTSHRVVDAEGIVHCAPAPGQCGCVLRWSADPPVSF